MRPSTSPNSSVVAVPAAVAFLACAPAAAQDPATVTSFERVVVTGSSVPRVDAQTPSPVQVITREDMRNSGRTSVQQVLRDLTSNGQGALSQSFPGAFASGAGGVSLRGLTVGSTLVLIDGHRMAPFPIGDDAQRSFVDIANLPFDAVERIEVLKDSGSSVYGSDAIAGVVNIILRRNVVGSSITADVGTSAHGGGAQRRVSGLFGIGDLAADGHNIWLGAEYRKQDRIYFTDRGGLYTQTDFRSSGGDNISLGARNPTVGDNPPSGTGYVTDPAGNIAGFMPGCDATRFAADQCLYRDTWHVIQPRTENLNLTARWTQKLSDGWQLSLQGSYFDSKSEQIRQPARTFPNGYQGVAFGPGRPPVLLAPTAPTTIPSTNPSFPTGTGLSNGNLYYTFIDLGGQSRISHSKSTRAIADLQGRAGAWDVSASLGYTQVVLDLRYANYVQPARLQAALDRSVDPYLVGGANSAAVRDFIAPSLTEHDTSRLAFARVGATRDVATLAGGPLTLALGIDEVYRSVRSIVPTDFANGLVAGSYFTIGSQNVASVYSEIVAPVAKALELEAGARYDHYTVSGGRVSPKLGFKFTASPAVAFVGTVSRGFRAPNPSENGNAGQSFVFGSTNDPLLCADNNPKTVGNFPSQCSVTLPGLQTSNPALRPERSTSTSLGVVFEPAKGLDGRIQLWSISVADQIVVGGTPTSVRGTALVVPPAAPIAYQQFRYVNANRTRTRGIDLDLHLKHRFEGIGEWRSGLTLSYTDRYDLIIDGVTYRLAGTHGPFTVSGDTGNPRTRLQWSNTLSRDAWQVSANLNYVGPYGVTDPSSIGTTGAPQGTCVEALGNSGGHAGDAYASVLATGQLPAALKCRVPSFTTVDLTARYQVTKQLELHGSVQNLFDRGAPADWATYGGAGAPYNPALHLSGAIGRTFNIGATLRF